MAASGARLSVAGATWWQVACSTSVEAGRRPRLEGRAADGRRAALVETGCGKGVSSHVLIADAGSTTGQGLAVFEGRVERMEWQGTELLLAFAPGAEPRVFSVYPGIRIREAAGPGDLHWLRLSTRRSRR